MKIKYIFSAFLCFTFLFLCAGCDSDIYKEATNLLEQEKYAEAKKQFEEIPDYEDSKEKIKYCDDSITYQEATKLLEQEKYEEAKEQFEKIPDYEDSKKKINDCDNAISYIEAVENFNNEKYSEANNTFLWLGDYKDSKEYAIKSKQGITYNTSQEQFEKGNFSEATSGFKSLNGFSNSKKYLEAIDVLKLYQKTWESSGVPLNGERNNDSVFADFTCTISAPYKFIESDEDPKGWYVTATVGIQASYIKLHYTSSKKNIVFEGNFFHYNGKLTPLLSYDNYGASLLADRKYPKQETYVSDKISVFFPDANDTSSLSLLEYSDSFSKQQELKEKK